MRMQVWDSEDGKSAMKCDRCVMMDNSVWVVVPTFLLVDDGVSLIWHRLSTP